MWAKSFWDVILIVKNVTGGLVNILSLFDGISACQVALNRLNIPVNTYYSSEIDKYAISITQKNFPNTVQLGDVIKWKEWDVNFASIDLVTAGFPCQAWSLAGKQFGDKDERGALFWVMLEVMSKVLQSNPNAKFLIENVKMKKEFEQYITYHTEQALGKVNKHLFNSSLVSAQNRQRYYWTNINGITAPRNVGLTLKDILEKDPPFRGGNMQSIRPKSFSKDGLCHIGTADLKGIESLKRVYHQDGKCPTLTTMGGGHREPKIIMEDGIRWRKLTPLECERLQTFEDDYTKYGEDGSIISNSQRYKCLGNSWTVDIICHIFKNMVRLMREVS